MDVVLWRFVNFAMVVCWLALVGRLQHRLATKFPDEYERLGRPGIIRNNTPRTAALGLKWIISFSFLHLHDRIVSVIGSLLIVLFPIIFLWMFGPFFGLFVLHAPRAVG